MYENIGSKIKGLAKVIFIIEVIIMVIAGLLLTDEGLILMGLMLIFVGPLIAWLSSLVLYGFGELVEKATLIHEVLSGETEHTVPPKNLTAEEKDRIAMEKARTEREKNAKKLLDQGLITEEQYKQTIGK